jgi:hypothetical protein
VLYISVLLAAIDNAIVNVACPRSSLLLRSPVRGTLVPGIAGFRPWFAGPGNRTFELVEYVR